MKNKLWYLILSILPVLLVVGFIRFGFTGEFTLPSYQSFETAIARRVSEIGSQIQGEFKDMNEMWLYFQEGFSNMDNPFLRYDLSVYDWNSFWNAIGNFFRAFADSVAVFFTALGDFFVALGYVFKFIGHCIFVPVQFMALFFVDLVSLPSATHTTCPGTLGSYCDLQ